MHWFRRDDDAPFVAPDYRRRLDALRLDVSVGPEDVSIGVAALNTLRDEVQCSAVAM